MNKQLYNKWIEYVYSGKYFKVDEKSVRYKHMELLFLPSNLDHIKRIQALFKPMIGKYKMSLYTQTSVGYYGIYIDLLEEPNFPETIVCNMYQNKERVKISILTHDKKFDREVEKLSGMDISDIPKLITIIQKYRPITNTKEEMRPLVDLSLREQGLNNYDKNVSDIIADYASLELFKT
jgi:hypothetical protein